MNGELNEEIYMEQLEGFIVLGQEKKVCRLIKSLYGLKQAPKQWNEKFDNAMMSNGFRINVCILKILQMAMSLCVSVLMICSL